MLSLDVRSNVAEFIKGLDDIQKKQVPYATSLALTRTAQFAQEALQKRAQTAFHNTKKWWNKGAPTGIKVARAKKKNLVATVYTAAYFASLQEEGGIKTPFKGSALLIPTFKAPPFARKSGGHKKVFSSKNTLTHGGSPFIKLSNGHVGVFQRTSKKRLPIQEIYNVKISAKMKARFEFKSTAYRAACRAFEMNFYAALHEALSTAR